MVALNIKIKDASLLKEKQEEKPLTLSEFLESNPEALSEFNKRIAIAEERGIAKGRDEGYLTRSEEIKPLLGVLSDVEVKFEEYKEELKAIYEPFALDIGLMAAEKILARELISGTAALENVVKPVINDLPGATNIKISLNPQDYDLFITENLLDGVREKHITLEKDSLISRGGCFIESDIGNIDATLETRIELLEKSVKEE